MKYEDIEKVMELKKSIEALETLWKIFGVPYPAVTFVLNKREMPMSCLDQVTRNAITSAINDICLKRYKEIRKQIELI